MVVMSHNPLCFWLPRLTHMAPPSSPGVVMVPAHRGILKITFPTLSEALPSEYAGQGRDLNLQFSDVLRLQIRAYLICRLWFILIMIFALVAGILNAIFNSPISLIPLALILGMWMLVTRMVMNRYGDLLQDYEALAQYRLSMLAQSLTNAGIQLKVGTAVYWIEVTLPTTTTIELK